MAKVVDIDGRLKRLTDKVINSNLDSNNAIFSDKIEVAKNLLRTLASSEARTNHVILAASMQSGKTAVMNALCNIIQIGKFDIDMGIKRFIFATGMNDVQLKQQTLIRALKQLVGTNEETICFDLNKATSKSKFFFLKNSDLLKGKINLNNSLLLLDEVQYGTNENNALTRFLVKNKFDWKDTAELRKRNLYIVSVSATPFNEMVSDTKNVKKVINISKGENYIGVSEFYKNGQILDGDSNDIVNGSIFGYIDEAHARIMSETNGCGVIFIRTRDFVNIKYNTTIEERFNVLEIASNGSNIDYSLIYTSVDKMITRYKFLQENGRKHTKIKPILVLIKGAFRAGVSIPTEHKDYVYMVYDYSKNAETTAQALLGRMCGYRDISKDNWKRTIFYVNEKLAEQYATWENDYSIKSNIPCERMKYEWVDKDYSHGATEITSKSCGNIKIPLSDKEIAMLYSKNKKVHDKERINSLFQDILKDRNINTIHYDYIGETHLSGKNNYARSSQIKRFESFNDTLAVFKFRPEKIKEFLTKNNGRTELIKDDIGTKAVYLVLDANIVEQEDNSLVISGNKELLVYYVEVANRTKVGNRKSMFKEHKCTDLNRKFVSE